MNTHKVASWVRLACALGAGNSRADDILMHFSSADEFFDAKDDAFKIVKTFTDREIASIKSFSSQKAEYICEQALKIGCNILTPDMDEFPARLKNIPASPLVLYVKGDSELIANIDNRVAIATVGTRDCSEYGLNAAYRLSYDIARAGGVIVSGMALGTDTEAHRGAIDANGKTIAVLGCGADICYPYENRSLMENIIENGAVITEYAPSTRPEGRHFPIRNRIMSGISLGVLMVEARMGSGALITVKHAAEQGKDIFTVPISIYEKNAAASLALIRDGAIAVGCARHVLEEYSFDYFGKINMDILKEPVNIPNRPKNSNRTIKPTAKQYSEKVKITPSKPIEDIDSTTTAVYNTLIRGPININDIASLTNLPITKVLSALTTLEMLGLAKALPGRRYIVND